MTFSYVSDMIAITRFSKIMGTVAVVIRNKIGLIIVWSVARGSSGN